MKVWAAMEHTDEHGKREVGEEFELPRDTDEQKAIFEQKLKWGLISTKEITVESADDGEPSSSRRRRSE